MPKFYEKDHLLEAPPELESPGQVQPEHFNHPLQNNLQSNIVETLITWKGPSRPFRKKDRSFYTTVATLIILVSMIALLLNQLLLIGALFAIGFVVYVLNFIPPEDIEHKISTQGITSGEEFFHWDELDSFWLGEKEGHKILYVLTNIRFPALLLLVLDGVDEETIKRICASFLPFHEIPPKTIMDKWSEGLQKHFPLENPHR
jgi:hypothetical protein